MSYKQKYLKYKKKYNNLKLQIGSGPLMDKLLSPEFDKDYEEFSRSPLILDSNNNFTQQFRNIQKYFGRKLLNELKADKSGFIGKNIEHFIDKFENIYIDNLNYLAVNTFNYPFIEIVKLLTSKSRNCSLEQFMNYSETFNIDNCNNYGNYAGNCGFPSLRNSIKILIPNVNKIYTLFNLISTKLQHGKKIGIIIGAIQEWEFIYDYDINLYFNECSDGEWRMYTSLPKCTEYQAIDTIINEIQTQPLKKDYLILNYFPLNTHPSHMPLLKLIVEFMKNYDVYLINKMCGTCFGSFYYLKKEANIKQLNFKYINYMDENNRDRYDPQNLGIDNCFIKS